MRKISQELVVMLCLASLCARGQGTLIYDQQSATVPLNINYDTFVISRLPLMQAFVPTLSSIGFVQLQIEDYLDTDPSGARIAVGIFGGSPGSFTFLGISGAVYLPSGFNNDQLKFSGVTNFYFTTLIALTPGQTYYLEPIELAGDHQWSVAVTDNTYPNGSLYGFDGTDLWFREGVVAVPEPSDLALFTMGGLLMAGILGLKGKHTIRNRT